MRTLLLNCHLWAFLAILFTVNTWAGECNDVLNRAPVEPLIKGLTQLQSLPNVWPNFRAEEHSYVFLSPSTNPGCAVVWNKGKAIAINSDISLNNTAYDYCGVIPFPECPVELKKLNLSSAMIFKADLLVQLMGTSPVDIPSLNFDFFVHEIFHLFGQRFESAQWPTTFQTGMSGEGRQNIKQCYEYSAAAISSVKEEIDLLHKTIEAIANKDISEGKSLAKRYSSLRIKRQSDSSWIVKDTANGFSGPCSTAEAVMEMGEGVPEYVGLKSAIESGILNRGKLKTYHQFNLSMEKVSSPYYQSGAYMLLALSLDPTVDFRSLIQQHVTESNSVNNTIFAAFSKWCR